MENTSKYKILLNETYLYVLCHPNEKIIFNKICKEIGLSRQTVSKQYNEFKDWEDYNIFNITSFYTNIQNKYTRAYCILCDILGRELSVREASKYLGCNKVTFHSAEEVYNIRRNTIGVIDKNLQPAVYTIKYKGEIIYIGSTDCFNQRKKQHLKAINSFKKDTELNRFFFANHITEDQVEIEICVPFLYDKLQRLEIEKDMIKTFKPRCNVQFL